MIKSWCSVLYHTNPQQFWTMHYKFLNGLYFIFSYSNINAAEIIEQIECLLVFGAISQTNKTSLSSKLELYLPVPANLKRVLDFYVYVTILHCIILALNRVAANLKSL